MVKDMNCYPSNANCVGPDVGTATDEEVTLQSHRYQVGNEAPRLTYARTGPALH